MAEESQRVKLHTYQLNSNLVIQRDRSSRLEIGPSDEVKTLSITPADELTAKFGSAIKRALPEKKKKKKIKHSRRSNTTKRLKRDAFDSDTYYGYKPQSIQTKRVYDLLLSLVAKMFSGESHELIKSCADMTIELLKNEKLNMPSKRKKLEKLLKLQKDALKSDQFNEFVNIVSKISDFSKNDGEDHRVDEDVDVPIEFSDDHAVEEVIDEEDESEGESESGEENEFGENGTTNANLNNESADGNSTVENMTKTPQSFPGFKTPLKNPRRQREQERQEATKMVLSTSSTFDSTEGESKNFEGEIDLREIEAYWLQKKISKFVSDPLEAQKKAAEVEKTISEVADARSCENKLVELLGFDAFDFIKLLMRNRLEIIYCVKLAQCDEKERADLITQMGRDKRLCAILDRLNKRTTSMQDRTKKIREDLRAQAANLKKFSEEFEKGGKNLGSKISGLEDGLEIEAFEKRININLENLAFKQGGHTMTNKKWVLPEGSKKIQKKGFIEIYVPYKKRASSEILKSKPISELPKWAQKSFIIDNSNKLTHLNHVQTACFEKAFKSDDNLLLCAPTGAGKTVVAQLCILREIEKHFDQNNQIKIDEFKIVYVAPMKSLVREMAENFSNKFSKYGISVRELTGDQQLSQEQISRTQIIITTPEKWDIVTRKSGERTFTQLVRLVIIDEVHLLHDSRGPVLEAIVARSLRHMESTKTPLRLVGLSATLPNYENVAVFMRVPEENVFFFDQGYRPCPLTQCFVGLASSKPYKRMEKMNEICFEKVTLQRKKQQQILIFVHSRRETYNTGLFLKEKADENDSLSDFMAEGSSKEVINEEIEHLKDTKLKELLVDGIAIHHAGLCTSDRRVVEDLFRDRHISVLVSTATLAWGVNLPAHCVIIKGTQVYSPEKSRWTELSMLDVMQMTGRAGRPGLDSYGEAYILTTQKELKYYMSLLTEQLPIESQLISKIADILNAEIALGTISNIHEAIEWLKYTYLYVRMISSPELYGVPIGDAKTDPELRQRRIDIINSAAILLDKTKLIHYDRKSAIFNMTAFGTISAQFYLSHETMKTFREYLKPTMGEIEILRVFCLSQEFAFVTIREEEKLELAKLLDKVPIPVKESAEEPTAKVNVLLQAFISRLKLDGFQLQSDMQYIVQSASRLLRALFTIALKSGWANVSKKCLSLCKCVDWRMWAIESPVRQFPKDIAPIVFRRIERKEYPWTRWLDLKPHEIGTFIDHTTQGKKVHKAIHAVPRVKISGQIQPVTRSLLRVELTLALDFVYDPALHYRREPFWIFVEDVDGEVLVYNQFFLLETTSQRDKILDFVVPILDPLPPQYFIRVFSDRFLGSESMMPISLSALILPSKFAPPTELFDFTAQPIDVLGKKEYVNLYDFKYLNGIQTQAFKSLYKTDNNVLICAPTGSGKTFCAELTIFKFLEQKSNKKCVYIAPIKEIATATFLKWQKLFGNLNSDVIVGKLSGDMQYDQKLLSGATIIVANATDWNAMQRRWRKRKPIQNVGLFIMDEMHLLTSRTGHIFEECISRMRYISSQVETKTRFIGLSASVANAQDLGEWIGCKFSDIFNFAPSVRPTRLDLSIQSFDINNFEARQLAMVKPAYHQIITQGEKKPVLIFVPSKKFARKVAVDLVNLAAHDGQPDRFINVAPSEIAFELDCVSDALLRKTLAKGVAFFHQRLSPREKQAVAALCKAQAVQVAVVEQSCCWSVGINCFMAIVMGTTFFDGTTQNFENRALFDLLQMLGCASRPLVDAFSRAVVFCEAPRKEFLKRFLHEPFPVESTLDAFMADYMNAEIVSSTIENVQEAVDFLTWTFLYRRLHQNPNFYNLYGTTNTHVSQYLSRLSEETLEALENAGCIQTVEDKEYDILLSPMNLGHIASYYNVQFGTIEIFASMLDENTILRKILQILSSSEEFLQIPVLPSEIPQLTKMARTAPLFIQNSSKNSQNFENSSKNSQNSTKKSENSQNFEFLFDKTRSKIHLLFQAHFSRQALSADLKADQRQALKMSLKLLYVLVDVASSNGWLKPAVAAMELCQMMVQGMWDNSPALFQLPHIDEEMAEELRVLGIESPLDFDADNEGKIKGIDFFANNKNAKKLNEIFAAANAFPNPDVAFEMQGKVKANKPAAILCRLSRDEEESDDADGPVEVISPRYPLKKIETWWLVLGQPENGRLLGIKRVTPSRRVQNVRLEFVAPSAGRQMMKLYLISDSYVGIDQEYQIEVNVVD